MSAQRSPKTRRHRQRQRPIAARTLNVPLISIAEISRALASQLDSESVWDTVYDHLNAMFDATTVFIALYLPEIDQLQFLLSVDDGIRADLDPIPLVGVSRAVVQLNSPLFFGDMQVEAQRLASLGIMPDDREPGVWSRAWMGAPLRARAGDAIGLISVQHVQPREFDDDDMAILTTVASTLSLALDNRRLNQIERERRLLAEALTKIGQLVSQNADYDEVLEVLLDQFQRVVGYDSATSLLAALGADDVSKARGTLKLVVSASHDPEHFFRGAELTPLEDTPPARSAASRQPIVVDLPSGMTTWWKDEYTTGRGRPGSWLVVPMVTHERVVGLILLGRHRGTRFVDHDASSAFALARQGAIALENARLYAQSHAHTNTLQQRARRLASLNRMSGLIGMSLDSREVLQTTAQLLNDLFEVDHTGILLFTQPDELDVDPVEAVLTAEFPATGALGLSIPVEGNPMMARLMELGTAIPIEDVNDPSTVDETTRATLERIGSKSALLAPLIACDRMIGSIGLDMTRRRRTFTAEECEMVMTIAGQVAMAVTNAQLYEQALTASRLKSAFLANISHELRTPLNAVIGYSDMLLSDFYGELNKQQRDRVNRINTSGRHLLSLIDDVLDLSKIEAGQVTLARAPLRVSNILDQVIGEVLPAADEKKLTLSAEIRPDERYISADLRAMHQVVSNLVHNAIKFTREGGVTVTVQPITIHEGGTGEPALLLPKGLAVPPGDYVALAVRDTGIGIAPENQKLIFETFRQVDNSTVREYGGTGLGLAITKRLVALHEGHLWVESDLGAGSTFTVLLPAIPAIRRPDAGPVVRDHRPLVLVIDDDVMTIQLIQDALDAARYQVVGVEKASEGLKLAHDLIPDVIITDVMMPGMSGWDVLQAIRQEAATQAVPVVMISVLDQKPHGLAGGAAGYLIKPIDQREISALVERLTLAHPA